jgi:class 3 adenylate cyclase
MNKTLRFQAKASRAKHGLVMIYDLEGFSRFFNQPDVHDYITKYLNHINEAISICINGGTQYWIEGDEQEGKAFLQPVHVKFMGDGALYIWVAPEGKDFETDFIVSLMNRMWSLKHRFYNVIKKCADDVPVFELPKRIRFGFARGTIYELMYQGGRQKEYLGICINLASRLQKYCSDLGFIASARVQLPQHILQEHTYKKVVASDLKGFPKEIVLVDIDEFEALDKGIRAELFEEI